MQENHSNVPPSGENIYYDAHRGCYVSVNANSCYDVSKGTYVYRQPVPGQPPQTGTCDRQPHAAQATEQRPAGQPTYPGTPAAPCYPQSYPHWQPSQSAYGTPPAYPQSYPVWQGPYAYSGVPPYAPYPACAPAPSKGMGIASMVLGILSLMGIGMLFLPSLIGLILGIVQYRRTRDGFSLAGIITNIISLVIFLGYLFFLLYAIVVLLSIESSAAALLLFL